jgi:diguanylate cyclase (GGDEF)-like protein
MDDVLSQERQRARRMGTPFSALMIDIDHFKQVNDRLGHAAGDHTLRTVAQHLRQHLRTTDVVARWGGEEFLVLLPATSRAEACHLADKLCESVRSQPIPWGGEDLSCTVSIGVAQWRPAGDTADALLARADQALYCAKHEGRNQVRAEPTMVQTGHIAA